jgi:hypothetical protein
MVLCEEYDGRAPGNPSIIGHDQRARHRERCRPESSNWSPPSGWSAIPTSTRPSRSSSRTKRGADVKGHPQSLRLPGVGVCDAHISLAPIELKSFESIPSCCASTAPTRFRTTFWVTATHALRL